MKRLFKCTSKKADYIELENVNQQQTNDDNQQQTDNDSQDDRLIFDNTAKDWFIFNKILILSGAPVLPLTNKYTLLSLLNLNFCDCLAIHGLLIYQIWHEIDRIFIGISELNYEHIAIIYNFIRALWTIFIIDYFWYIRFNKKKNIYFEILKNITPVEMPFIDGNENKGKSQISSLILIFSISIFWNIIIPGAIYGSEILRTNRIIKILTYLVIEIPYYTHIILYWFIYREFAKYIPDINDKIVTPQTKEVIQSMTNPQIKECVKNFKDFYFIILSIIEKFNRSSNVFVIIYFIIHLIGSMMRVIGVVQMYGDVKKCESDILVMAISGWVILTIIDLVVIVYTAYLCYDVKNISSRAKKLFSIIKLEIQEVDWGINNKITHVNEELFTHYPEPIVLTLAGIIGSLIGMVSVSALTSYIDYFPHIIWCPGNNTELTTVSNITH